VPLQKKTPVVKNGYFQKNRTPGHQKKGRHWRLKKQKKTVPARWTT